MEAEIVVLEGFAQVVKAMFDDRPPLFKEFIGKAIRPRGFTIWKSF